MPTQCYWDDAAQTIIRMDYTGSWTWEEFFQAADEARRLANSVPHRVDYISDLSQGRTPLAGSPLSNGKSVMRRLAPNSGIVATVTSSFTAALLNVFKKFDHDLGQRMIGVPTLAEAYEVIARERAQKPAGGKGI
jgi:hypothetical protein